MSLGWPEMLMLVVIALLVFGPDRLPKVTAQAGRGLRQLRRMANSARQDLREGLGPEFADFDITDLHPRRFVQKHLFEGEDPLEFAYTEPAVEEPTFRERPPFDPEAT